MVTKTREPLTIARAAELAHVSGQTIQRAIRRKTLKARKMGWQWFISREDFIEWNRTRRNK